MTKTESPQSAPAKADQSTALAKDESTKSLAKPQPGPLQEIRTLLEKQKNQIALALPKHLTPDRMVRVCLTVINKNPDLLKCTQTSLLACIMDCAALGLEPDGRRAHLIPYGNKCTLIVDYKGLVELAMNSGEVSKIHADIICVNDDFEYNMGTIEKHKINFRNPRGDMYAVYCVITMKDATSKHEVMHKEEVDAIRKRSRAGKAGPWVTDYNEMAKKTVFRRASKWIKLSPELREKIEKDDEAIDIDLEVLPEAPKRPIFKKKDEKDALPAPEEPQEPAESAPVDPPAVDPEPEAPTAAKDAVARLKAVCVEFNLDEEKAENWLASQGMIGKGQTTADLSEDILAEIEKNPAKWVNRVVAQ